MPDLKCPVPLRPNFSLSPSCSCPTLVSVVGVLVVSEMNREMGERGGGRGGEGVGGGGTKGGKEQRRSSSVFELAAQVHTIATVNCTVYSTAYNA